MRELYWTEEIKSEQLSPRSFNRLIDGYLYRTSRADLIAADRVCKLVVHRANMNPDFDTEEWVPALFLFRTHDGSYFLQRQYSKGANLEDEIERLSLDEAVNLFDRLPEKVQPFEIAFPDIDRRFSRLIVDRSLRRKLVRALQRAITATFSEEDWLFLGEQTNTTELIKNHDRLLRSLYYRDDDYPTCVIEVLSDILEAVDIEEVVSVVEDQCNLRDWLRENEPTLYRELYSTELSPTIEELESLCRNDIPGLMRYFARIKGSVDVDPEAAIGHAKDLLEAVLKTILGVPDSDTSGKLPKLVKTVRKQLELEGGRSGDARDLILNGLTHIATGVYELRNVCGSGHGRSGMTELDPSYAHLAVDSTAALARFFLTVWRNSPSVRDSETGEVAE